MRAKILIVDKSSSTGMSFLDSLRWKAMDVAVVDDTQQAIKNVKQQDYDLILLGDRINKGDTYDVALEIKSGKNKHTAVVCVGKHRGRTIRLMNLLSPYALWAEEQSLDITLDRVRKHFSKKEEKGSA